MDAAEELRNDPVTLPAMCMNWVSVCATVRRRESDAFGPQEYCLQSAAGADQARVQQG